MDATALIPELTNPYLSGNITLVITGFHFTNLANIIMRTFTNVWATVFISLLCFSLNYYGMNYPAAVPGCDPSYFTTSPVFHQMTTSYPSSNERIGASDYTHSPLLLPHMNEISYPQMVSFTQQNPSYPQQSPTYTSPSTSPSEHDHSYLPSYTFPGTQLAFTPIA